MSVITIATEHFTDLGKLNLPMDGPVLGSSQFSLLPQLPKKMMLASKVVKIDSKIIISFRKSKSMTHFVVVDKTRHFETFLKIDKNSYHPYPFIFVNARTKKNTIQNSLAHHLN